MVGDGANDALAIKKSDLGIAMFDGAGATRQIAQIVLMNNSFAALPVGVSMAETIITNIELVASIFFNKVTVGLALFVLIGILGHTYPLSPRNTTIINYVTIWLPMIYWAVFPAHKIGADSGQSFLRKVLPYSLLSGALTATASVVAFLLGPKAFQTAGSNILVVLTITALEFWFFVLAPVAYGIAVSAKQKSIIWILGGLSVLFFLYTMFTPGLSKFFDLGRPGLWPLFTTICIIVVFAWIQYQITKRWFNKQPTPN
jgi:cation-transporting ATPase E